MRRARYAHGGDRGRRLSIRILVGEVPSNASALPNQCRVVISLRSRLCLPGRKWWSVPHASHCPPRNADCRGGVFATRRFPRPPPTPAMRVPSTPQGSHLWEFYVFSNDAARRVATVFETCNFLIETDLCARRENLPRKIEPLRAFRRGSPFGKRRFKTYSPVSRRT